jgi:hypothetical protein
MKNRYFQIIAEIDELYMELETTFNDAECQDINECIELLNNELKSLSELI